jgi:hypothetical protein
MTAVPPVHSAPLCALALVPEVYLGSRVTNALSEYGGAQLYE